MIKRLLISVLGLCSILFASASAHANVKCKSRKGEELWLEGYKAYNLQKYAEAITYWEQAYLECDDPNVLFNLAQANRKAKQYERARELYKAWLRSNPQSEDEVERAEVEKNRALAKKKIAELEKLIEEEKQNIESPPDGLLPKDASSTTGTAGTTEAKPDAELDATKSDPSGRPPASLPVLEPSATPQQIDERRRWTQDTWGWILAGTGAAASLTGAGFLVWSQSIADDARGTADDIEADRLFDDADTKGTIGVVTLIGGGALLVGGIVHFALFGRDAGGRDTAVSVGPSWMAVAWSF